MFQFHFARRCFRIRLWPALACLLVIGVTLSAARWQTARAHYKQSLADAYAAQQRQPALDLDAWSGQAPPEFARATVSGTWRDEVLIYADNQVRDGQAGFLVHMPLCQTEKRCVLVARGWVRHGGRRDVLPPVASPAGPQRIEGVVTRAQPRFVELSADAIQGAVWQNVTVDRVAKTTGLQLAPFILVQTGDAADDLRRDDVKPEFGVEKHWMYAAQWYAFALVTLVFGLYAAMQKEGEKS
jgi:surfeit locus 1 family protein